ncbi:unnamed protein product [Rotaria sordida]|uniref:Uncharacterized protein n=1 Tax=Rotaria sordida TaxID=392033 RepID=A0A819SVK1_9BILA|nr:unnamed protein product [Rotaria sordida]
MSTYFRVISLETGEQIVHIAGLAFFTFHHINSTQIEDNKKTIIVDICGFDDPRLINSLELDLDTNTCMERNVNAREPKESHCYSHVHSLVPVQFELPCISPKFIDKERCTIRQDPIIDSVIFKAYENLPKIALDYGLERELAVPRTVIVSDPSSGKSMLVQMFLRFPCAFSHANVGTRCPVKYILRYDLNLPGGEIRFIEPKHWQAKDLCKKLELEMKRIEKTHRHEGSFRLELFTVEIASKHYTDFEILDVSALVRGDLDANKRAAVERITKHYVCDPSFMIVQQLKEAQQLADNTYGTRRIGELCINKPALDGSKFPSRKNYAQHTVTIQTKNHHSKSIGTCSYSFGKAFDGACSEKNQGVVLSLFQVEIFAK